MQYVCIWVFLFSVVKMAVGLNPSSQVKEPLVQSTWIGGSKYGPFGIPDLDSQPSARYGGVSVNSLTVSNQKYLLFGGAQYVYSYPSTQTSLSNDLWEYNPESGSFSRLKEEQNVFCEDASVSDVPIARKHSVSFAVNSSIFIVGGFGECNASGSIQRGYTSDVWKYDILDDSFVLLWGNSSFDKPMTESEPGAGYFDGSSIHYNNSHCVVYLYFGERYNQDGLGLSSDFWSFNLSSRRFKWIGGDRRKNLKTYSSSGLPNGRKYSSVTQLNATHVILFGGMIDGNVILNDLWLYGVEQNLWTLRRGDPEVPECSFVEARYLYSDRVFCGSRYGHTSWKVSDEEIMIFGGYTSCGSMVHPEGGFLSDLFVYHVSKNQFKFVLEDRRRIVPDESLISFGEVGVENETNSIPGRAHFASFFIPAGSSQIWRNSELVIYGGRGNDLEVLDQYLADFWSFRLSVTTDEEFYCEGISAGFEEECHHHGTCVAQETCLCDPNYYGARCLEDDGVRWKYHGEGGPSTSNVLGPSVRIGDKVYVFGSSEGNDLWVFDLNTRAFELVLPQTTPYYGIKGQFYCVEGNCPYPKARVFGAAWSFPAISDKLIMFGGMFASPGEARDAGSDVWEYIISTKQWIWIQGSEDVNPLEVYVSTSMHEFNPNNIPQGRNGFVTEMLSDTRVLVYGGATGGLSDGATTTQRCRFFGHGDWPDADQFLNHDPTNGRIWVYDAVKNEFAVVYEPTGNRVCKYGVYTHQCFPPYAMQGAFHWRVSENEIGVMGGIVFHGCTWGVWTGSRYNVKLAGYVQQHVYFLNTSRFEWKIMTDESQQQIEEPKNVFSSENWFKRSGMASTSIDSLGMVMMAGGIHDYLYAHADPNWPTYLDHLTTNDVWLYSFRLNQFVWKSGERASFQEERIIDDGDFHAENYIPRASSPKMYLVSDTPVPNEDNQRKVQIVFFGFLKSRSVWEMEIMLSGTTCYGIFSTNEDEVCSGHGNCIVLDECECHANYTGPHCNITVTCYGQNFDDIEVCSGHGVCEEQDHCVCDMGYSNEPSAPCMEYSCFGIKTKDPISCNRHGECVNLDTCICQGGYYSDDCYDFIQTLSIVSTENSFFSFVLEYYLETTYLISLGLTDYLTGERFNCSHVVENFQEYFHLNSSYCYFEIFRAFGFELTKYLHLVVYDIRNDRRAGQFDEDVNMDFLYGNLTLYIKPVTSRSSDKSHIFWVFNEKAANPGDEHSKGGNEVSSSLAWAIFTFVPLICVMCCIFSLLVFVLCCCLSFIVWICFPSFGLCSVLSYFLYKKQNRRLSVFEQLNDFEFILKEQLLEKDSTMAHIKINKKLFEIPFEEVEVDSFISEGGSEAKVYRGTWRSTRVAFKLFKTKMICSNQPNFDAFEREVALLANLKHPFIVDFYGASLKPPRVGIVMELCENGEIHNFFLTYREKNKSGYPYEGKIRMCLEIISALEFIHSRNIIHRDVKPENILVDSNERCKLMDFGISRVVQTEEELLTRRIGTSLYISPEVLVGGYDRKCDVFSFGILLWVLFTENGKPYGESFQGEFAVANDASYRPSVEEFMKQTGEMEEDLEWLVYVMQECWGEDPEKRKEFKDLAVIFQEHL